jgi:hypothetical protein
MNFRRVQALIGAKARFDREKGQKEISAPLPAVFLVRRCCGGVADLFAVFCGEPGTDDMLPLPFSVIQLRKQCPLNHSTLPHLAV